jgi:hypothetical protein
MIMALLKGTLTDQPVRERMPGVGVGATSVGGVEEPNAKRKKKKPGDLRGGQVT